MSSGSPVLAAEIALRDYPIGRPGRAWALYELAKALQNRFSTHHSKQDLESAKKLYSEAIEHEPELSKRARYFNNLGVVYQYRYNDTGEDTDLDAFLDYTQQATHHISDELRPAILSNYANALQNRYYKRGDLLDLDECIRTYRDALNLQTANRTKLCSNICAALITRFQAKEAQSDLDEACSFGQEAVSSSDDQHPMRSIFLDSCANALHTRYLRENSILDLDESINLGREAVWCAEEQGLPELPGFRVNVGGSLASRFKISRDLNDIEEALEMFSAAEESLNTHHPNYGTLLVNKGNAFRMKFEETASEADLASAVDACTRAVKSAFAEANVRSQSEDALGYVLLRKYELTGSPDILDEAVGMYKRALQHSMNGASAADNWHNLGTALETRFELRGSLEDLDDAIEAIETGLSSSGKAVPDHASSLIGLGNVLVRRFERLRLPEELDRAISVYDEALRLTTKTDRTRAGRLTCLGHALQIRFELAGSDTDFEDAVRYCQASVDVSDREPTYYLSLINLGNCFLRRVVRESPLPNQAHLNKAVEFLQTAANEMPEDFSTRAMCLNNLGKAYELQYERTGAYSDFNRAAENYAIAVRLGSSPPMLRLMAGYRGMVLAWSKNPSRAVMFLQEATKLLPMISPRLLNRADQQDNIATFSGFGSIGASILLESGSGCLEALQTLELSRGIMSSLLLEARIDTTNFEKSNHSLAKEFIDLRDQLDSSPSSVVKAAELPIGLKLETERRIAASKRFNEVIDKLRSDDTTKHLFFGQSIDDLQSLSKSGSLVVINVSSIRSDALIVTTSRIWHYHLKDLSEEDVLQQAQSYLETLGDDTPISRKKTNKSLHNTLKWLWDTMVSPILSELGIVEKAQEWPRIWWIPVGLISVFPIHAAGDHSGKTNRNALDRVISSYATTIRSLSHSRRMNKVLVPPSCANAVFVAMSSTPSQSDLNFAEVEVAQLLSSIPDDAVTKVVFRSPTHKQEVLSALENCNVAHFSCHGLVDPLDPSNSCLLLSDWETSPLTVADINALKLAKAKLAYLSACHASSNRVLNLLDEGIHLASAFQVAGFPQAIGTLWQVDDERSGLVSKILWDNMLTADGTVDFGKAAEGLHHAVRELRERTRWVEGIEKRFPDQPIVWAPFVHIGI